MVQAFPSSQFKGVYTQLPVEGLQLAKLHKFEVSQETLAKMHCPFVRLQESTVQSSPSSQVTKVLRHCPVDSSQLSSVQGLLSLQLLLLNTQPLLESQEATVHKLGAVHVMGW